MTMTTTAVHAAATGNPAYTETMPCRPESARKARMLVALALSAWGLDGLVDDARLVVSEFVGNSAEHTGCHRIRVTVTRRGPDRVRVAVMDKSVAKPVLRAAGADDENGRGLAVVAALAETTGTDTFGWGKRTWADLRIPGAEPVSRPTDHASCPDDGGERRGAGATVFPPPPPGQAPPAGSEQRRSVLNDCLTLPRGGPPPR